VARTLIYISDLTGFDCGEYFRSPNQVRGLFQSRSDGEFISGLVEKTGLNQNDLDEMVGAVIPHKRHCVSGIKAKDQEFASIKGDT
jgi:hypothetical protein